MNNIINPSKLNSSRIYFLFIFMFLYSVTTIAQTTWTGTTSADWNVTMNWSAGIPSITDDVTIPAAVNNAPTIMSGSAFAKSITVNSGASLNISTSAGLTINNSAGNAITTSGTLTNNGTLEIGNSQTISGNGIRTLAGTFFNDGTININNTTGASIANINAIFTHTFPGIINIGDIGGVAADGIRNRSTFNSSGDININNPGSNGILCETSSSDFNNLFRNIIIRGSGKHGIWNRQGDFTNDGRIFITSSVNVIDYALNNEANFINGDCDLISLSDNFRNTGTIANNGDWYQDTQETSIAGNFTNNSIIQDISGSFPTSSITNNQIVISGVSTSSVNTVTNAFDLGPNFNLNIVGVYTDFSTSTSAGNYDLNTNTFTASPNLSPGLNTVIVRIQDPNCLAPYLIAWNITVTICPMTCSSGADKCWNLNGPDNLWSNPDNWCPIGVPTLGQSVDLGSNATVDYDVNSAVISKLDIGTNSALMITSGTTLEIDGSLGVAQSSLLFNFGGNITNQGNLIVKNAAGGAIFSLNNPTARFQNHGDVFIQNTGQSTPGSFGIAIQGSNSEWLNEQNSSIQIQNAMEGGIVLAQNAQFQNLDGASVEITNSNRYGIFIVSNSKFDNFNSAILNIYNMNSGATLLESTLGSELLLEYNTDIKP